MELDRLRGHQVSVVVSPLIGHLMAFLPHELFITSSQSIGTSKVVQSYQTFPLPLQVVMCWEVTPSTDWHTYRQTPVVLHLMYCGILTTQ